MDDAKAIHEIRMAISEEDTDFNFTKNIEHQHLDTDGKASLVAEIDGKVVGYIFSTTLYAGFGIKRSAWIMAIGVFPEYMGQGIGLQLAEKVCEIFKEKGIENIYSSVRWDSTDILSFFKKLGFERSVFINLKRRL